MSDDYSREQLISICEQAIVPVERWHDRDSPAAQLGVGEAWALLKSGCDFTIRTADNSTKNSGCITDERIIWIEIEHPTFNSFEEGGDREFFNKELFFLPTPARLQESETVVREQKDWY